MLCSKAETSFVRCKGTRHESLYMRSAGQACFFFNALRTSISELPLVMRVSFFDQPVPLFGYFSEKAGRRLVRRPVPPCLCTLDRPHQTGADFSTIRMLL